MKKVILIIVAVISLATNMFASISISKNELIQIDDSDKTFIETYKKMNTPYQKAMRQIAIDCMSM